MPLIIATGYPASGKTTRANALAASLRDLISASTSPARKSLTVTVVNDESIGITRNAYAQTRSEKDARATFSSAVKRELGRERIVIADGMNYIKGFRYQLFCEAKALGTPSCCLHIATTPEHSQKLNQSIEAAAPGTSYSPDLLDNLIFRYEEPSGFARWDSPLFTLPVEDSEAPAEAIFYALVGGGPSSSKSKSGGDESENGKDAGLKSVRPNLATVAPFQTAADALQRVDRICAISVKKVQTYMSERGTESEGQIALDEEDEDDFQHTGNSNSKEIGNSNADASPSTSTIRMPEGGFSVAALQRLRREFVGLIRANPGMATNTETRIRSEFASFVNRRTWEDD